MVVIIMLSSGPLSLINGKFSLNVGLVCQVVGKTSKRLVIMKCHYLAYYGGLASFEEFRTTCAYMWFWHNLYVMYNLD